MFPFWELADLRVFPFSEIVRSHAQPWPPYRGGPGCWCVSRNRRREMSEVITQTAVEDEIRRICDDLESMTREYASHSEEAARRDVDYKLAEAKELLKADGRSAAVRAAQALLAAADAYEAKRMSEALRESALQACRSKMAQLSSLQSLLRVIGGQV